MTGGIVASGALRSVRLVSTVESFLGVVPDKELDDLYRANFAALVRVAFLLTGSAAEAEDAVQDAFLRCAPRLASLEHPQSYLRKAVVNECRTRFRKRDRERSPLDLLPADLPHDLIETSDALASLSYRKRAVVVLRYFVDLPDEQIADVLGCRPSTVRSVARRALIDLKEVLT